MYQMHCGKAVVISNEWYSIGIEVRTSGWRWTSSRNVKDNGRCLFNRCYQSRVRTCILMKNIKCKCGYMIVERNIQKAYVYYECGNKSSTKDNGYWLWFSIKKTINNYIKIVSKEITHQQGHIFLYFPLVSCSYEISLGGFVSYKSMK